MLKLKTTLEQAPIVRAVPDGKIHQTLWPELHSMHRDELVVLFNRAMGYVNRGRSLNEHGKAVFAEWNGRVASSAAASIKTVFAAQKAESEFYCEVKEALMDEGRAEHVAANIISTEVKLLAEARRLGII